MEQAKNTSNEPSKLAQSALESLSKMRSGPAASNIEMTLVRQGTPLSVVVPREAFDSMIEVLEHIANGDSVVVVPDHAELTSQQAADLLNVSRPFLISLLTQGAIPYRRVGTHRRLLVRDVHAYKRQDDAKREAAMDELTAEAEELGLGY